MLYIFASNNWQLCGGDDSEDMYIIVIFQLCLVLCELLPCYYSLTGVSDGRKAVVEANITLISPNLGGIFESIQTKREMERERMPIAQWSPPTSPGFGWYVEVETPKKQFEISRSHINAKSWLSPTIPAEHVIQSNGIVKSTQKTWGLFVREVAQELGEIFEHWTDRAGRVITGSDNKEPKPSSGVNSLDDDIHA